MKYIKTYENLLKGKSESRILTELEGKPDNEKIETLIKLNRFDLLPRYEDGVCVYNGNLNLSDCDISILPDNLIVKGNLVCVYNQLTRLPDNLEVVGNLFSNSNLITSLPENLKVGGDLYCYNNEIVSLPNNLTIDGVLDCSRNHITRLPENLIVKGNLVCSRQKTGIILELPKSAKISGNFYN